jgi:hypothetical protein
MKPPASWPMRIVNLGGGRRSLRTQQATASMHQHAMVS